MITLKLRVIYYLAMSALFSAALLILSAQIHSLTQPVDSPISTVTVVAVSFAGPLMLLVGGLHFLLPHRSKVVFVVAFVLYSCLFAAAAVLTRSNYLLLPYATVLTMYISATFLTIKPTVFVRVGSLLSAMLFVPPLGYIIYRFISPGLSTGLSPQSVPIGSLGLLAMGTVWLAFTHRTKRSP
jgi:hypothetical protein